MVNSTTVEVTWELLTNGIVPYYTVVYYSVDDMEMKKVNVTQDLSSSMGSSGGGVTDLSITNVTVLVSGLYPFTNYTFYVLAVTVTSSEPSDNVTVVTDEAGNFIHDNIMHSFYACMYLSIYYTVIQIS